MPAPTDITSLRSFLGAVNFYAKFVRKMHQLRRPFDALLKKDVPFHWSSSCQESFEKIKEILLSDLLLTHYDPKLEIIIAADASKSGIGAVAMHRFPDGSLKAVAHASRTLTQAEAGYSQIEKEGLALVFAVTKFHRMILGRKFTLQTDHQPLLRIFGSKKGIPLHTANRLQRWALTLLCYDFEINYVSTTQFGYADVLSRLIDSHTKPEEDFIIAALHLEEDVEIPLNEAVSSLPITFNMVRKGTFKCAVLQQVIQYHQQEWPSNASNIEDEMVRQFYHHREALSVVKGCLMMLDRLVIPNSFRHRVLRQLHRGHPGIERMKAVARSYVFWPKIDNAIENFVKKCNNCATHSKTPPKVSLQAWPQTINPWERIHIDFAGPFFDQYFLVVVDAHSKWPEVKMVRSPTTSVVNEFLDELFSRFGVPSTVVSDNGSQFTSEQFAVFCNANGIQHLRTAPYHPQSNGQAERFVDTLKRSLLKINEGEKIAKTLQVFLQAYRSTPSRTLQEKSPAEVMLGRKMRTVLNLLQPSPKFVNQQQRGTVSRSFKAGDNVYAKVFTANKWIWSPGVVIESFGNVNYNVLLEEKQGRRKLIRSHANQLKQREADNDTNNLPKHSPLNILVDMFGLQPSLDISVANSCQNALSNVLVDSTTIQENLNPVVVQENPFTSQEAREHEAIPEQPITSVSTTPDVNPEEQTRHIRPQRFIRMPSRLEPYLVFWK